MAVEVRVAPKVSSDDLNELFDAAWQNHKYEKNVVARLQKHSLSYICAFDGKTVVGFVNLAWDGGVYGFILDTSVPYDYQRQGIGVQLVQEAAKVAKAYNLEWLHVDYEERLEPFYAACGFVETKAGLIKLRRGRQ